MSRSNGYIYAVNGPVIKVKGDRDLSMQEMVYVGSEKLIGEVIGIEDEYAIVQVYEDTTSLRTGEEVKGTGSPLSATLAPGILLARSSAAAWISRRWTPRKSGTLRCSLKRATRFPAAR